MTATEALNIISALVEGHDPLTGEILPVESLLQRASIVRAMTRAVRALQAAERAEARKKKLPGRAGRPWTGEEDEQLLSSFDLGALPKDLAGQHERTIGAIRSRLLKHGRLDASKPQIDNF